MSTTVQLTGFPEGGSLLITSTGNTSAGNTWKLRSIEGWYGSPPIHVARNDYPMAQYSTRPNRSYRKGREYAIIGTVTSTDANTAVETAWQYLGGLNSDGEDFTMIVYDDSDIPKSATVWLADTIEVRPLRNNAAAFVIPLYAHDGRKQAYPFNTYKNSLTLAAGEKVVSGTFTNLGTADSQLVIKYNSTILEASFPIRVSVSGNNTFVDFSDNDEGNLTSGITGSPEWGGTFGSGPTLTTRTYALSGSNDLWPFIDANKTRTVTISVDNGTSGTAISTGSVVVDCISKWW